MPIRSVKGMAADGTPADPETHSAGITSTGLPRTGGRIEHAIALSVMTLAGEATVRVANASGILPDDEIGATEPEADLTVELILAAPSDASLKHASAYAGWHEEAEAPDEAYMQEVVASVSETQGEADAMAFWLRARTAAFVSEPRFLHLAQRFAAALLDLDSLEGEHATHLFERWDQTYKPEEEVA